MGWIERLCETYDACMSVVGERIEGEPVLIPVAHSTANAQIEVYVSESGEFIEASIIEKNGHNEVTIIPATEDSDTRTGQNAPHPLHDNLCYVAGDYVKYTADDKRMQYHGTYMDNLKKWVDSEYGCNYLVSVYEYLKKGCLIKDLIEHEVLTIGSDGFLAENENKIHNLSQTSAFVRFGVIDSAGEIIKGWEDKELYALYEKYYIPQAGYYDICFASGLMEKCAVKHPKKLRNPGDKAKLISGADKDGFTFRGRFSKKEQAVSVGYVASQKAHNALRWLIQRQGYKRDGSTIVIWNIPTNATNISYDDFSVPDVYADSYNAYKNADIEVPDTGKEVARDISLAIHGYNTSISDDSRIIMMSVDAATQGRLAIEYYHEFSGNEFLENLKNWHKKASVMRLIKDFNTGQYVYTETAPSAREIALAAYGTDRGGYLAADDVIIKNTVKRILLCIMGLSKSIPKDITRKVLEKLERPQAYSSYVWNNHIYPVAQALLKYEGYFDKGEAKMDPVKERSLVWGKLLAVLDEAENRAMYITGKSVTDDRLTNAKKVWNKFVHRPITAYEQTYRIVLQAYMKRLPRETREYFEYELNKNIVRLQELNGFNNEPLKPEYLVGYQEQKFLMRNGKKKEEKESA